MVIVIISLNNGIAVNVVLISLFPFSGDLYAADLDYDLKTWLPGNTIVVDEATYIPTDFPLGTYDVRFKYISNV